MSLDNGHYIITSPSFGGRPVGRSPIEDLSLLPKQVYVLPDGVTAPKTIIEKSGSGYKIKAFHAPTGEHRGNVCAMLVEEIAPAVDWVITARPQHGDDIYTIEMPNNQGSGWVVNDTKTWAGNALNVKPLVSTRSIPPQFAANSLFKIVRVDNN